MTSPDASLTRLSPSRTVTSLAGSLRRCSTALAATASGGETMAPSATPAGQGSDGMSHLATSATITVVKTTAPTDNKRIGRSWAWKSRQTVK